MGCLRFAPIPRAAKGFQRSVVGCTSRQLAICRVIAISSAILREVCALEALLHGRPSRAPAASGIIVAFIGEKMSHDEYLRCWCAQLNSVNSVTEIMGFAVVLVPTQLALFPI